MITYKKIKSSSFEPLDDKSGYYLVSYNDDEGILSSLYGANWFFQDFLLDHGFIEARLYVKKLEWFVDGKWHNQTGPAVIARSGAKYWALNGTIFSKEDWMSRLTEEQLTVALSNQDNFE